MPVHRHKKRTQNKKPPATGANGYPEKADEAVEEAQARAVEEAKARALECKAAGNEAFAKQDWLAAVDHFSQAIALDSSDHVFYSNRSAANLALKRTTDAVADGRDCVRLAPRWPKGYSRLGAACWADRQLQEAEGAYLQGLRLDDTPAMQQSLKEVRAELAAERAEAAKEAAAQAAAQAAQAYEPVIGIDLGTTYSAVAVWDLEKQGVVMLQEESGSTTVPSYVGWSEDGERVIGERAKQLAARAPGRVLYDVKRLIGRKHHEVKGEKLPFEVLSGAEERVEVRAAGKTFVPEQVSAMVLARMKEIAEARLGHPVTKAVVTVPAYFNDAQRKATQAAGAIAGLEVLRIINEPTAAALGYGLDQKEKFGNTQGSSVLVFDFGGGTFDVSVLCIEDGIIEVKATGGDTRLGGEDIDQCLSSWLVAELKQRGVVSDAKVLAKVRRACENAKRDLSTKQSVAIELDAFGGAGELTLSRDKLQDLAKHLFDRCFTTVKRVLADAKLATVDDIVLVGGSTRIPLIQEQLVALFGKPLCKSIHPDEAVAYGAAVQGAILSGVRTAATSELLLIDVTPLSLGIETEGRHFSVIIPRNTSIPCSKTSTYTTTENYQEEIDVPVFEGEKPCVDQNRLLGEFSVTGIERAKEGEAEVDVTFSLDANGVLNVLAVDKKTKARAECTINDACKGLAPEDIARMVQEAEECKEEDAVYELKLEVKAEIEDAAYEHDDTELLEWLDGLVLADTPMELLEKKRSGSRERLRGA